MIVTTPRSAVRHCEEFAEQTETTAILDEIDRLNRGEPGVLDTKKEYLRENLLARAKDNDGVISPREQELIDKATESSLTPEERTELINLLPKWGKSGDEEAARARAKSNQELIHDTVMLSGSPDPVLGTEGYFSLNELFRRASADGKMSAELNDMFSRLFSGKRLGPALHGRFCELLQKEDNLV